MVCISTDWIEQVKFVCRLARRRLAGATSADIDSKLIKKDAKCMPLAHIGTGTPACDKRLQRTSDPICLL